MINMHGKTIIGRERITSYSLLRFYSTRRKVMNIGQIDGINGDSPNGNSLNGAKPFKR